MESPHSILPKLIFIEQNHFSPLVTNLLTEWTPKLKIKGYQVFYAELPENYKLKRMVP